MWVLIVAFIAYGDSPSTHFSPTTFSQEFLNQKSCIDAADAFKTEFSPTLKSVNSWLQDKSRVGEGKNSVTLNAFCVRK